MKKSLVFLFVTVVCSASFGSELKMAKEMDKVEFSPDKVTCNAVIVNDPIKEVAQLDTVLIENLRIEVICSDSTSETWAVAYNESSANSICVAAGYKSGSTFDGRRVNFWTYNVGLGENKEIKLSRAFAYHVNNALTTVSCNK